MAQLNDITVTHKHARRQSWYNAIFLIILAFGSLYLAATRNEGFTEHDRAILKNVIGELQMQRYNSTTPEEVQAELERSGVIEPNGPAIINHGKQQPRQQ